MGVSYQTKNRLRRKVMTAPLSAPPAAVQAQAPTPSPARAGAEALWPLAAAVAVAVAAFFALYRG